jgi:hypothetical protein
MFDFIKTSAIAAVAALSLGSAASAITFIADGDSVMIAGNEQFIGGVTAAGGAGSWSVNFTSTTDPLGAEALVTIGPINFTGFFKNVVMSWTDAMGSILSSTALVSNTPVTLATTFTAPNLSQNLVFTWDKSLAGANFDVEVQVAAVPLPAGGLLLIGGLAGLAGLRRRKANV